MTKAKKISGRAMAFFMAFALLISLFSSLTFADETEASYAAGTYTVSVELRNSSDTSSVSMAAAVMDDTATLTVSEDGSLSLELTFPETTTLYGIECYVTGIDIYGQDGSTLMSVTATYTGDSVTSAVFDLEYVPDDGIYQAYIYSSFMNSAVALYVDLSDVPAAETGSDEDTETDADTDTDTDADTDTDTNEDTDADAGSDSGADTDADTDTDTSLVSAEAGTYCIEGSLSAYVSAMGGIEFAGGLLEDIEIVIGEDGTYYITLYLTSSEISVYGVTAQTFIDATTSTAPGYYQDGVLTAAGYTLSSETVTDSSGNAVNYVDTITFALCEISDSYYLYIYLNSSVMGTQFGDETEKYQATLTLEWDTLTKISDDSEAPDTSSDEVTSGDTSLEITGGDGLSIMQGEDLVLTTEGDAEITSVEIDGEAISAKYYTIEEDTVTISADLTETLSLGSHTVTLVYSGETAETEFTVTDVYGLEPGTYYPSASLSAYISAMGGIQFGSNLLNGVKVVVNEDGTYTITVYFKTASVDIYSTSVSTFIDASDSTPGYYNSNGSLVYASYTLSSSTATDADGNSVHYVSSMTFTVDELSSSYYLWIYVNSSVMGVQFGNGKGDGSSNQPGVSTPYAAILTIDFSSVGADTGSIVPLTGQSGSIFIWIGVLVLAVIVLAVLLMVIRYRRKKDKNEE